LELFENTNLKLRKIKAGLQLYTFIKDRIEPSNPIYFLLDTPVQELSVDFVVSQGSSSYSLDTSILIPFIKQLNSKYGVNISIKFEDINDLANYQLRNRTLYAYSSKSIYKYQYKPTVTKLPLNAFDSDHLFSDIEINIKNPIEFF